MGTHTFMAQDAAGTRCRIKVMRDGDAHRDVLQIAAYQLEDGTPVYRVDNDTFKVPGTGAYITLVREYE